MLVPTIVDTSMTIKYDDDKSYTCSSLTLDAPSESIYQLAQAINSVQDKTIKTVKKSVTTELVIED